jgi:S1-C subfamily serine protease
MEEIVEIVNRAEPGDSLELTLLRDGKTKTADVTLGDRPDSVENPSQSE